MQQPPPQDAEMSTLKDMLRAAKQESASWSTSDQHIEHRNRPDDKRLSSTRRSPSPSLSPQPYQPASPFEGIPIDPFHDDTLQFRPAGHHFNSSPVSPPAASVYRPNNWLPVSSPKVVDYPRATARQGGRSQSSHYPQSPPSANTQEDVYRRSSKARSLSAASRSLRTPPKHAGVPLRASSPQSERIHHHHRHMSRDYAYQEHCRNTERGAFAQEDSYHHTDHWTQVNSSTSVGMGIVGLFVDYVTPFGPAHNSGQLDEGKAHSLLLEGFSKVLLYACRCRACRACGARELCVQWSMLW